MTNKVRVASMLAMATSMMPPDYLDSLIDSMPKPKTNFDKPEDRADCRTDSKAAIRRRKQAERNQK